MTRAASELVHVKQLAVGRDLDAVGVVQVIRDRHKSPVGGEVIDLADDRAALPGARRRDIGAAATIGGCVVRAHESRPGRVLVPDPLRLTVGADLDEGAIVVAGHEPAARERHDGGRAAAVLFPQGAIGGTIPHADPIAAILGVVQLAVRPERAFGKLRVAIDDLDLARPELNGQHRQTEEHEH